MYSWQYWSATISKRGWKKTSERLGVHISSIGSQVYQLRLNVIFQDC